jgi:glycosyltransferase involved in cell wall biosynthesis
MDSAKPVQSKKLTAPLVSIAVATYNGENFLRQQIDSLLCQQYDNIEIVISDDKSTDSTHLILEEYSRKDPRIIYSQNPHPNGFKKNFERAIILCRGEIIFLCDQDDIWHDNKVSKHVESYITDKTISWVYNEVRLVDGDGRPVGYLTDVFQEYYTKKWSVLHRIGGRCILGCATSYRAADLKDVLPINNLAPGHDSYIQLALHGMKSLHLETILQEYRQHDQNVFGVSNNVSDNIHKDITKSIAYTQSLSQSSVFLMRTRLMFFAIFIAKALKHVYKKYTIHEYRVAARNAARAR